MGGNGGLIEGEKESEGKREREREAYKGGNGEDGMEEGWEIECGPLDFEGTQHRLDPRERVRCAS